MGSKKQKSTTQTNLEFPQETQSVRDALVPFLTGKVGEESPFYSDLSRMFSEVASKSPSRFQLPSYLAQGLEEAVTTGFPSLSNLEDTPYYKATYPEARRSIYEDIIPAVTERFGAGGGLRTTDYAKAATKAGGDVMSNFILNAASQAFGMEEAAKQRKLEALPTAIGAAESEYALPYALLEQLTSIAKTTEEGRYPLLDLILALATASPEGGTRTTTAKDSGGFDFGSLLSGLGSAGGGAAALLAL